MNRLDIQIASLSSGLPRDTQFQQWVDLALPASAADREVVIRIVDETESARLNEQYRKKNGPTNILSFPFECPPHVTEILLGDLVICAPVVAQEARQQRKKPHDHWAHITIHGLLHLLGYDHIDEADANRMEAMEVDLLSQLYINNPYQQDIPS